MTNDYLFDRYLRKELTDEESHEFKRRLREEPETAREFAAYVNDTGLMVRVASQMELAGEEPPSMAWSWARWLLPLAAAAGVLAVAGVWLWMNEGQSSSVKGGVVAKAAEVQGECRISFPSTLDPRLPAVGPAKAGPSALVLKPGDEVRAGSRIETGKDGAVTLVWVSQPTTVQLARNSTLDTRHLTLAFLARGRLTATVAKPAPGKPFVIETPHARMTVVGTKFSAKANQAMTRLDVEDGQVRLDRLADGATISVAASQFAFVREGLELAAYAAGTKYIKGRLLVQDDFEKGLDQWELVQAADADNVIWNSQTGLLPLHADTKGLECRIVPRSDGQAGKCLMLSAERGQGRLVGIRLKRSIGIIPFVLEREVFVCKETTGRPGLTALGAAFGRYIDVIHQDTSKLNPDAWMRFRTEWIPAEASYGNHAWQISCYGDNKLAQKVIVEDTKTDRFPFVGALGLKAYVDNIRLWELVSVEKAEDQAETIYEDTFVGGKLDPFWESVMPASQVKVSPPDNKSALVLSIAGKDANRITRENLTNEVSVTSKPIALQPGVLVLLVTGRSPHAATVGVSPLENATSRNIAVLDDSGQSIRVSPIDEVSAATAKAQGRDAGKEELFSETHDKSLETVNFYCFYPSGRVFCRQNKSKFWGQISTPIKSIRLGLQFSAQDPSVRATWALDRVVVRRLDSLPEDEVDRLLTNMLGEAATK